MKRSAEIFLKSGSKKPRTENLHTQMSPYFQSQGLNYKYNELFPKNLADEYFKNLEEEVTYMDPEKTKVVVYGKKHKMARKVAAYGDPGKSYTFSGLTVFAKPWTPTMLAIKQAVEEYSKCEFNFVLINRYADGSDTIGAHRDDEKELIPDSTIASVSLGQERYFVFTRPQHTTVKIALKHGSILLMLPPTNRLWKHALPKSKFITSPRINLTFRQFK